MDVITAVHVISVVDDPGRLIEAAKRALNPRGELLFYLSRMSKRLPRHLNGVARLLGFHGVNMRQHGGFQRRRAGLLNECYHFVRHAESRGAASQGEISRAA